MDSIEKKIRQIENGKKKQLSNTGFVVITILLLLLFFCLGRGLAYFKEKDSLKTNYENMEDDVSKENENTDTQILDETGKPYLIVVDAGHGGKDPGKVGNEQVLEKDINLSIATKLKELLEASGIQVIMTRTSDAALYKDSDKNQKMTDLNNRIKLIEENSPNFVISIHQNSYTDPEVKGAQVFYLADDTKGKTIAASVQSSLNERIPFEKPREIKGNGSYYLLKKCPITTVIVECGFLSNPQECKTLTDENYQNKLVDAIVNGILTYIQEFTE